LLSHKPYATIRKFLMPNENLLEEVSKK